METRARWFWVGLGLFCCVSTGRAAQDVSVPDWRLGTRTAPILLLTRPDVIEDLRLSPDQAKAATEAVAQLHERAEALRGKTGAEVVAARRSIDESQQSWIDHHLSPEQRARLGQVELQWEGATAVVSRAHVAAELELTEAQRNAISRAIQERPGTALAAQQELAARIMSILTEPQKARWKQLLGRPFQFHPTGTVAASR